MVENIVIFIEGINTNYEFLKFNDIKDLGLVTKHIESIIYFLLEN